MRLEKIAEEFGPSVSIEWKAFLLRPYPEPRTAEEFRKYTEKWQRPAEQPDAGVFNTWSTDEPPPSHSVPPAVAAKAAARQGADAFARYHRALMDHYFRQNHDITSPDRLAAIAGELGLDVPRFLDSMRDPEVGREVVDEHNEAVSMGIGGVPTVIVDGRWKITGAVPTEVYREVVSRRLRGEDLS